MNAHSLCWTRKTGISVHVTDDTRQEGQQVALLSRSGGVKLPLTWGLALRCYRCYLRAVFNPIYDRQIGNGLEKISWHGVKVACTFNRVDGPFLVVGR